MVHDVLKEHGDIPLVHGVPSTMEGKPSFPAVVCASLNEQVVHGIPKRMTLKEGDGLSIDTACKLNGWCGDSAVTLAIGAIKPEHQKLLELMQQALNGRASGVRVTHRLTNSPSCLVSDERGMSLNLERLLKASGQHVPVVKPVLEINPSHPVVERLEQEADPDRFSDWSQILFDQATLAEGGQLDDPAAFVKRLNELMLALAGGPASRIWTPGA